MKSLKFPLYKIISSAKKENFASFSIWMPFKHFSCLIDLARTSSTMLKRSGESGHSYLTPDLWGNAFKLLPFSMMLTVDLSYMSFIMLRYSLSIPHSLGVYIMVGCEFYQMLFCLCWDDHIIFTFHYINATYHIYWLHTLNHSCIRFSWS